MHPAFVQMHLSTLQTIQSEKFGQQIDTRGNVHTSSLEMVEALTRLVNAGSKTWVPQKDGSTLGSDEERQQTFSRWMQEERKGASLNHDSRTCLAEGASGEHEVDACVEKDIGNVENAQPTAEGTLGQSGGGENSQSRSEETHGRLVDGDIANPTARGAHDWSGDRENKEPVAVGRHGLLGDEVEQHSENSSIEECLCSVGKNWDELVQKRFYLPAEIFPFGSPFGDETIHNESERFDKDKYVPGQWVHFDPPEEQAEVRSHLAPDSFCVSVMVSCLQKVMCNG